MCISSTCEGIIDIFAKEWILTVGAVRGRYRAVVLLRCPGRMTELSVDLTRSSNPRLVSTAQCQRVSYASPEPPSC